MENKENFYKWLNKNHPNTSLRPLQKVLLYAYFLLSDTKERLDIINLIDEFEEYQATLADCD